MNGLSIGIGIGVKYQGGMRKGDFIPTTPPLPEDGITDALLMEDGILFLMEDGSYFKLEQNNVSLQSTVNVNKSYWNF